MGIKNINVATCDGCGRIHSSEKKQSDLLKELKASGWEGNISTLKCPSCVAGSRKFYGSAERVIRLGNSYFVVVRTDTQNGKVTVYIPYSQFASINANTLPSIEAVQKALAGKDDHSKVSYKIKEKKAIEGRQYLIADYLG